LIDDRSNGFRDFISGELTIVDVEADHFTICNDEPIGVIAQKAGPWIKGERTGRRRRRKEVSQRLPVTSQ
jgi:hypothetical protein